MDITIAIKINCQRERSITMHTLTLLCICQNSEYTIVTVITPFGSSLATMFVVCCILFAQLSIIAENTPDVLQQYTSIHFNTNLKLHFDQYGL